MTEIINAKRLDSLSTEKQREFEGILPLLVKKLILNSCTAIDSIRMPHGEDIWAPGFDGVVHCSEQTTYVMSGNSVWEFGSNKDTLQKVNEDYDKRTLNSLGIEKKETSFYFVSPKIWAFPTTKTEWENKHADWKQVKIYDASVLCDWINSQPAVCAWLMETLFDADIEFSTLEHAWNQFSRKTSPCLSQLLFLGDRDEEVSRYMDRLHSSPAVIRVKATSHLEAAGFVLSAMMQDPIYKETCIVINSPSTYRAIKRLSINNKIIILNYPCNHDVDMEGENTTILCYGKEDVSIHPDVEISLLTKYHFINAFKAMGISSAEELYYFTHGNLRALIRRIPGTSNEQKPEWADREKKDLLAPLLFLRSFNKRSDSDKRVVEELAGESFAEIEKEYQNFVRMEDSPIKVIDDYYVLVNYEEVWDTLQYSVNCVQYERLTATILSLLDRIDQNGVAAGISSNSIGRSVSLQNLFLNYVYFSLDDPTSQELKKTVERFLTYYYLPNTMRIILLHMNTLAEAVPDIVSQFLRKDILNENSTLHVLFNVKDYHNDYTYALFAIDELTNHTESAVCACRILFNLYQKDYQYKTGNSPEDSLTTALAIPNTYVALTLKQKVDIIDSFFKEDPDHTSKLVIAILEKNSYVISSRYGRKNHTEQESITYAEYVDAIKKITEPCFQYAIINQKEDLLIRFSSKYRSFDPAFLSQMASELQPGLFDADILARMNYHLRKTKYDVQNCWADKDSAYVPAFDTLISKTNDDELPYRWLFYKYYECPDERLIPYTHDYSKKDKMKESIRKEAFHDIYARDGIAGVEKLLSQMEDISQWGWLIASSTEEKWQQEIAEKALEYGKINILAGILDQSSTEVFKAVYHKVHKDNRNQLFICMCRTDLMDLLETEEEKAQYWHGKRMYKYNADVYANLLKYYPAGLLHYCYETIKDSPIEHIHMVIDIINAIRKANHKGLQPMHMDQYELSEILRTVDQALYYTDEWGKLSFALYTEGLIENPNEGANKYCFYHPLDLIQMVENNHERLFEVSNKYYLPACAYDDHASLVRFSEALVKSDHVYLLGSILGRSLKGSDGFFPHESIRDLLEQLNNDKVDLEVYTGYVNSRGARWVRDGSDQMQLGKQFEQQSHSLEITHLHTAAVLRFIAQDYKREALYDHLHAELDP